MKKLLLALAFMVNLAAYAAVPTLKITAASDDIQVNGTTALTFTFSEPVSGFTVSDLNVRGFGEIVAGSFAGSGANYTATFRKLVEKTSASVIVDAKSYTATSDGSLGTYATVGINPVPVYYTAVSNVFSNLKEKANPQPRALLVGEELVNNDNSPTTRAIETFYVKAGNSWKAIPQGNLLRPLGSQKIRVKLNPKAHETHNHQGAINNSSNMPKATYADVNHVEGWGRPRLKAGNNRDCPFVSGKYTCGTTGGEFRIGIGAVRIDADDPIVYFNQKGKAHLHIFFSNTSINFASTNVSLRAGNTTAAGGTVNRSAYWAPDMINTSNLAAMLPVGGIFYYKSHSDGLGFIEPIPQGLKGIAGDPNRVPGGAKKDNTIFTCYIRPGVTATSEHPDGLYNADGTIPACSGKYYSMLRMGVDFTSCLADDGFGKIKLDSPDHRGHWEPAKPPYDYYGEYATNGCRVDYPHRIVTLTQNIDYTIAPDDNTDVWRLSSDNYSASLPGGASAHADYWAMWDPETMLRMTDQCNNIPTNCGTNYIGLNKGVAIASITAVGNVATVTTVNPHYLFMGEPKDYQDLRVRISGVSGADAAAYNYNPAHVIANTSIRPTAEYPVGSQQITVLNATQFTYILNSTPTDTSKTGSELTGSSAKWGDILCANEETETSCPAAYNEFHYGTIQ